jgi:hypothetical protein
MNRSAHKKFNISHEKQKKVDNDVSEQKKRSYENKYAALGVEDSDEETSKQSTVEKEHSEPDEVADTADSVSCEPVSETFSESFPETKTRVPARREFSDRKQFIHNDEWATIKKNRQKKQLRFGAQDSMSKIDEEHHTEENKQLYIETLDNANSLGNNMFLNSPWTVWVHKSDCLTWTEDSYTNIYVINSLGSFWRFFNNFHLLDKVKNQLFIMRNKVKPIWEDNENRNGGICSIKLDCFSKQGKSDVGVVAMTAICLLIMNETFVQYNNEEINGISYSIKNRSVLIKIWCKNFSTKISEKIPLGFFNKLDATLNSLDKYSFDRKKGENKLSIRYSQIKPEYELDQKND